MQFKAHLLLALLVGLAGAARAATPTSTITTTNTPTYTSTATPSVTKTHTPTSSITPTYTSTITPSITITSTRTITPSITKTSTVTPTITRTFTNTVTPSNTKTVTPTFSSTRTITATSTITSTRTITPTFTSTSTITPLPTAVSSVLQALDTAMVRVNPDTGELLTLPFSPASGAGTTNVNITNLTPVPVSVAPGQGLSITAEPVYHSVSRSTYIFNQTPVALNATTVMGVVARSMICISANRGGYGLNFQYGTGATAPADLGYEGFPIPTGQVCQCYGPHAAGTVYYLQISGTVAVDGSIQIDAVY